MSLRNLGLSVLLCFIGSGASARILFEPYVGYESGSLKIITTSEAETKFTNSGMAAGARLGIRNGGFWIAAEGLLSVGGKSKPETGDDLTYSGTTYLGSIGYDFMTRIRLFGSYGFQDTLVVKDTSSETKYTGTSTAKVGLGYYLMPHMAISVEYIMRDFKKRKLSGGVEQTLEELSLKSIKADSVLFTFSFPISF